MDIKDIAVNFLNLLNEGRIDEAYQKYIGPDAKHHNVYTPAGIEALKEAMKNADVQYPDKKFEIKKVLCDGDLVAVFSRILMNEEMAMSVVHIFQIKNGKIVELWDVGQPFPKDSPNSDGPF